MLWDTFPIVHESSFEKFRAFRNAYLSGSERVLEIGSLCQPGSLALRGLFPAPIDYVGLDIEPGYNVDFVPNDAYLWTELASESFDIVLSNQTFEHIPHFWITAAEIARVLRTGGLACVVVPSAGNVHRFPLDCWRFYPDSWEAVCSYVGLELLETYREKPNWRTFVPGTGWKDTMMVASKPTFSDDVAWKSYYDRLNAIVATRVDTLGPPVGPGRAAALYERAHNMEGTEVLRHPWNARRAVPPPSRWPGADDSGERSTHEAGGRPSGAARPPCRGRHKRRGHRDSTSTASPVVETPTTFKLT